MHVTDLDHGGTRLGTPFVILAVAAGATVPGVGSLHDPAFPHRHKAACSLRSGLHFDMPARPIGLQPGVQRMIVILVVAKDRLQSGEVLRRDLIEQLGSGRSVVDVGTGNQYGDQQAQRIHQQMPLAALDFLAAIVTPVLTADFRRLHGLAVDADRAGRRLAAGLHADLGPQGVHKPRPSAVVAPLREILLGRALGKQVVRQHIPLATAAVEIQDRVDDLAHAHFSGASTPLRTRGWNQRLQDRPLLIGKVRGVRIPWR